MSYVYVLENGIDTCYHYTGFTKNLRHGLPVTTPDKTKRRCVAGLGGS
jgi:hypothetical protein